MITFPSPMVAMRVAYHSEGNQSSSTVQGGWLGKPEPTYPS